MEKTQSASIPIIDRFAGLDDPRTERAGKRELGDITAGENGIRRTQVAPFGEDGSAVRIGRAAENVATDFFDRHSRESGNPEWLGTPFARLRPLDFGFRQPWSANANAP